MLTDNDKARISTRVGEIEARSGVEILTVYAARCDDYPEIPWKAFALGAALGGAVLALADGLSGNSIALPLPLALALCLCAGLTGLLLTLVLPPFARLFLDRLRAEAEAQQHAEGLFLQHELFAAPARRAVLLLVARFERRVVILPDRSLQETLAPAALDEIVAVMTAQLRRGKFDDAFFDGLAVLEPLLGAPGTTAGGKHLPDEPIVTGEA